MKILSVLLGYFISTGVSGANESPDFSVLGSGDAEFVEALVVSFLIVCVYLVFWLRNKGQG